MSIHAALSSRRVDVVRSAIADGADVNELNGSFSALEVALTFRSPEIVSVLLEAGANPNRGHRAPLAVAFSAQDQAAVDLLIARGADLAAGEALTAAMRWSAEAALAFLDRGAPLAPALATHAAKSQGAPEARARLMERAIAACDEPQLMLEALIESRLELQPRWVELLLARGASLTPTHRPSPLHVAARRTALDPVKVLLSLGASADTPLSVDWVEEGETWPAGQTVRECFTALVRSEVGARRDAGRLKVLDKVAKALTVEVGGKTAERLANPKAAAKRDPVTVKKGWRRFHHPNGRFWEATGRGRDVESRTGLIGAAGKVSLRSFPSAEHAQRAFVKACDERLGAGFVELGGQPPPARDERLEAALEATPDDRALLGRYAAWLEERQNPLGRLIAEHLAGRDGAALLKKHGEALLGPLVHFPRDRLARPEGERSRWKHEQRGYAVEWRFGFMRHLELRWDDDSAEPSAALRAVLSLPTARFLESLRVGPFPGQRSMTAQPALDVLVETGAASRLRALYLTNIARWDYGDTSTGDFGAVHAHFTRLETLTLNAGTIQLGRCTLPALRELTIQTGALTRRTLRDVLSMVAPRLERLSVWCGRAQNGADTRLADLAALLEGTVFPRLTHLGLMNCEWVGQAVQALSDSKLLPRLSSLDLSMGCLQDADVDAMQAQRARFAHLEHLNLHDNGLSKRVVTAGLARHVTLGRQDPARSKRYASVGE